MHRGSKIARDQRVIGGETHGCVAFVVALDDDVLQVEFFRIHREMPIVFLAVGAAFRKRFGRDLIQRYVLRIIDRRADEHDLFKGNLFVFLQFEIVTGAIDAVFLEMRARFFCAV